MLLESKEEAELKKAIRQEKKEKSKYRINYDSIQYQGYCNFLIGDYCSKYKFSPTLCGPNSIGYECTWKERRIPNYKIAYDEDVSYNDMIYEKRLTMFEEYYYDRERFNKENYQDMLDFYKYLFNHLDK